MGQKYCAFISYRHAPLDSKIAREIQQRLERFRVPGAIARRTGRKKLGSVFRDKEELPITSDLNDNINRALENSEYLIVICSPRTRDSIWVQKEIESFLQTHGRNRVLTVLAEGEPGDVIPELLLSDEVTDPETGQTQTVAVEPLSCDYRIPLRAARAEELPRLAATILGCGYDELRQRQRLYRARRLTAILAGVMALSIGMTAYFLWSNRQIRENYNRAEENYQLAQENYKQAQENYRQSMINQSVYLASESQKARKDGDPITAALLAMAALPQSPEDDRPVTPEAELALSQAVGAYNYDNPGLMELLPMASFSSDQAIRHFWLNDDASILAAINGASQLILWDTGTRRELWRRGLSSRYASYQRLSGPVEVFMLPGDRLLLWDGKAVFCLTQQSGEELWTAATEEFDDWTNLTLALPTPDGAQVLLFYSNTVVRCLDAADGTVLWDCPYPEDPKAPGQAMYAYDLRTFGTFSPDGQKLALAACVQEDPEKLWSGLILDLDARAWSFLPGACREIYAAYLPDSDTAVIMGCRDDAEQASADTYASYNRKSTATVFKTSGGDVVWETELPYYLGSFHESIRPTPDGAYFCSVSNVMALLDPDTGAVLARSEASSPIVDYLKENSRCKLAALFDGSYAMFSYETASCSVGRWFDPSVLHAAYCRSETTGVDDFYVLNDDSHCVKSYMMGIRFDEHFTALDWAQTGAVGSVMELNGGRICGKGGGSLLCISLPDGGLCWKIDPPDESSTMEPAGFCEETGQIVVSLDYSGKAVAAADAGTGALTELPEALDPEQTGYYSVLAGPALLGTSVSRIVSYTNEDFLEIRALSVYDLKTGEGKTIPLPRLDGLRSSALTILPVEDAFLIRCAGEGAAEGFRVDPVTGEMTPFDAQWFDWTPGPVIREAGRTLYGFLQDSTFCLTDAAGAELQRIAVDSFLVSAAYDPTRDCVLLLSATGQIYVCSRSAQRLAVIELGVDAISNPKGVHWQLSDPAQYAVYADNRAFLFDPETWKLTVISDFSWYVSGDRYFCTRPIALDDGSTSHVAAYYDRYSREELIALGRALVGDMTLKDPEKYGLPSSP